MEMEMTVSWRGGDVRQRHKARLDEMFDVRCSMFDARAATSLRPPKVFGDPAE